MSFFPIFCRRFSNSNSGERTEAGFGKRRLSNDQSMKHWLSKEAHVKLEELSENETNGGKFYQSGIRSKPGVCYYARSTSFGAIYTGTSFNAFHLPWIAFPARVYVDYLSGTHCKV